MDFAKERVLFETGLNVIFEKQGKDFNVDDEYGKWLIHPFLFSAKSEEVKLKEDHEAYRWIKVNELNKFDTVQDLQKNLTALGL